MKDIQWDILNQANKWFHFWDQHHKTSPHSDRSLSFQSSSEFLDWIVSPEWWLLKKAGTEVECIRLCCWTLCKDHHLKIITFIIILNYHQKYCISGYLCIRFFFENSSLKLCIKFTKVYNSQNQCKCLNLLYLQKLSKLRDHIFMTLIISRTRRK